MSVTSVCVYCKTPGDSLVLYDTRDIYGDRYTINRCSRCRAYFLSPNPTSVQLARAYDETYYGKDREKFGGIAETILDVFRKRRAAMVARRLPTGGNLLDIGCGNGRFLDFAGRYREINLFGLEMPGRAAERAARHKEIHLTIGELKPGVYPDDFFDAITLFHVFEHLSEPASALSIISRILKKGGVCVLSFPNIDSIQARLFKGRWLHLDPPRHLFYFAPRDFPGIAAGFGLTVENVSYWSPEQNPYGMVQSLLNCVSDRREILFEAMKGNMEYVKDVAAGTLFLHRLFFLLAFPLFVVTDWFESAFRKGATVQFVLRRA